MNPMRLICALAMILAFAGAPPEARAWRDDGHRIICHIAFLELVPAARAEVARLIRLDPVTALFEEACIWPDDVKYTTRRETEPWHYLNMPPGDTTVEPSDCPVERGCLLSAIALHIGVLADPEATDGDKLAALKFLGHWIGDLHQPLHLGFARDRGGNDVHVLWQNSDTPVSPAVLNPRELNLHQLWDDEMIHDVRLDPYHYAARLWMAVSDRDRDQWRGGDAVAWAQESRDIALDKATGYATAGKGGSLTLGADYMRHNLPIVETRLKQGGIRLANLLNRLLAP